MTKRCTWMIAGALFVLPAAGVAQGGGMQAWQEQTVADLEQMRDKFLSLPEAFPEELWDWTPLEGVRPVRDVMVLMVTEGHVFFGQATNGAGIVGHSVVDMHEHLGQTIAYARMNQIVPPWSR